MTEIAVYLVLNPGGRTAAQIADALSNTGRRLSVDSVRTYVNALRRALDPDAVPDGSRSGYTLAGVDTDWHRFETLAEPGSPTARAAALSLVRGGLFAEPPEGSYEWALHDPLLGEIETAIVTTATELATVALEAGDTELAGWASQQALLVAPTSETLLGFTLTAAKRSSRPDALTLEWRALNRRLARLEEPVPDSLVRLYNQLRDES